MPILRNNAATPSMRVNVFWNTVGSVFYQGCLWLLTVLVVRLSSDYQNSGILALAMSVGNVFTALGTFNMRTYQVADVKHVYSSNNYVALRLVTVCGGYFLCAIYALAISSGPSTLLAILAFLLFKADESFANVLYGCDQVELRLDIVGKSQIIRGVICVSFFTAGMLILRSLTCALLLIFLGCVLTTFLFDARQTKRLGISLVPSISADRCVALLKECLPSALGTAVGGLVVSIARQYFGLAYGEEALGIYASVATPCVIIQVLAQNLYTPFLGGVAEAYKLGGRGDARLSALRVLGIVVGTALALSLCLTVAGQPLLLALYGTSIEPYVGVLMPALLVMTFVAGTLVLNDLLVVFGRLKTTLLVNLIALFGCLAVIAPCTARWYMNGINIALIFGYSLAIAFALIQVFRCTAHGNRECK